MTLLAKRALEKTKPSKFSKEDIKMALQMTTEPKEKSVRQVKADLIRERGFDGRFRK